MGSILMPTFLAMALALEAAAKTTALVTFFAVWVAILLRLVLSKSDRYRRAARIPLEDEPVTLRTGPTESNLEQDNV